MDIKELKKKEPLYVIGHKNPDVDTVISSYLLSRILKRLGIKSYYCFLSEGYELDDYNGKIINDYLEFKPKIIDYKDVEKYNFVLVDHNDPIQSVNIQNNIIFAFDHHKNSNKLENVYLSKLCSNCLFIYDYFKNVYPFSEEEKRLVMLSVLTDTLFLKTDRYTSEDDQIAKELNIKLDSDELLKKYFIPSDLTKGIDKLLEKSDRNFSYHDIKFTSSVIHDFDSDTNIINDYKNKINKRSDNHLGMWRDLTNNKTYAFLKVNENFKEFSYNFIASRASTVMTDVIKYLKDIDNS